MQVTNEDRSGKGEDGERRMSGQNHDGDCTIKVPCLASNNE